MSTDLLKLASEPISSDNPVGIQLEGDPDYDKIDAEIQKVGSLHGGTVDWGEVVRAGTVIITQKSKDLSVAIWLCMGLFQQQGYKGLNIGLEICLNFVDKFWETMYPPLKRIRGRSGLFIWLASRITPLITGKEPSANEAEVVQSSAVLIEKLVQMIDEKFGDNSPVRSETPNLLDLRKVLQGYASKLKVVEEAPKPEAAEKPSEQHQTTATTSATSVPTEFTSAENAYQIILKAAAYLRESKPEDPMPYRLNRIIRWYPIEKLPPATSGKTVLPGILPQLVQGFQNLLNGAEWETLLRQSESNFINSPFWFDLQRFIDRAMTELGPTYISSRQAIREELAGLVRRLPGILDLQFKNGIPFADGQTKMWIDAEVMPSVAAAQPEAKEASQTEEGEKSQKGNMDQIVAEARRIVAGGKLEEAVSLLKSHLTNAPLGREQFLWRLNTARLCMDAGNLRIALPQLESLDEEMKKFSLEQWEPELAAEVVRALLQCRRKLMQDVKQPSAELTAMLNDLYARLCRLDVLAALNLDSGS
jgi:type VI secretion system protein VasJ